MLAKKQTQAEVIRHAIEILLPFNGGKVLKARQLLEGLNVSTIGKVSKPQSSIEAKPCAICLKPLRQARVLPFYLKSKQAGLAHYGCASWRHPADCACAWCVSFKARNPSGLMGTGTSIAKLSEIKVTTDDSLERIREETAKGLSTCACGHGSERHALDKLDNLLGCKESDCDCDHFHYAIETPTMQQVNASYRPIGKRDRAAMEELNAMIDDAEEREFCGGDPMDDRSY